MFRVVYFDVTRKRDDWSSAVPNQFIYETVSPHRESVLARVPESLVKPHIICLIDSIVLTSICYRVRDNWKRIFYQFLGKHLLLARLWYVDRGSFQDLALVSHVSRSSLESCVHARERERY